MSHDRRLGLNLGGADASLTLAVVGYQYPGASGWDGEWLNIAGKAHSGGRSWSFQEACLTTFELVSLIAWLTALADGRDGILDTRLEFTEPVLAISFERLQPSLVRLRVELALEAAPAGWDSYGGAGEDGLVPFVLDIEASPEQLRRAATDLAATAPDVVALQARRGQLL